MTQITKAGAVYEIGAYNVSFNGLSYEDDIRYENIGITEYTECQKPTGNKNTLYIRHESADIIPVLTSDIVSTLIRMPKSAKVYWDGTTFCPVGKTPEKKTGKRS